MWAAVVIAVCVKPLFKPVSGTVHVTYATAGQEFAAGRKLYDVPEGWERSAGMTVGPDGTHATFAESKACRARISAGVVGCRLP